MRRSILVLACLISGCSSYHEVTWGNGVSWDQARAISQEQIRRLADAVADGHQQRASLAQPNRSGSVNPQRQAAVPGSGRHVVMPGETLGRISERYNVRLDRLADLNQLERPYTIYVGQEIWLKPRPNVPEIYQVAAGDTFLGIAHDFGLRYDDMRSQNPDVNPENLKIGQTLYLARSERAAPPEQVQVAKLEAAATAKLPDRSGSGFLWPVEGDIVESFGAKPNGMRNDGINIAAAKGATVQAADAGVVVYAGEGLPAMGRMVMIRHADDFVTAYGHNQALLVTVGDRVSRGQPIARVGDTGKVSQAQLHFQIRKGTEPVDPARLLKASGTRLASTN